MYIHIAEHKGNEPKSRADIIKEIRLASKSGPKQPCQVCAMHTPIVHSHHVIPVRVMADYIIKYRLYDMPIPNILAWLCPNHHSYYHLIESGRADLASIPLDELRLLRAIASQNDTQVFEDLYVETLYFDDAI